MADVTTEPISKLVYGIALGICLICIPVAVGHRDPPPKEWVEMEGIKKNPQLTTAQKVEQLRGYFGKVERWLTVLGFIEGCDKAGARNSALELFRKPDTSTYHKLECGRYLLAHNPPDPSFVAEYSPFLDSLLDNLLKRSFINKYAPFLIDAVLKQGADEFMKAREDYDRISAVGEYAFIASGFEGHNPQLFEKLKDRRVIPVLVRCLDAPDYKPRRSGDAGRNVERQEIPIALARLNAVEAADKLKQVLEAHHDWYLRYNAAYALGFLLPRSESAKIEQVLHNLKDRHVNSFFFYFGAGLLEQGDAAGMQYISFKHPVDFECKDVAGILYMLERRLEVLRKSKVKDSSALTAFYRGVLTYAPLRAVLEFDTSKLEPTNWGPPDKDTQREPLARVEADFVRCKDRILSCYKQMLDGLKSHGITALSGIIAEIGERTRSKEVRALSHK